MGVLTEGSGEKDLVIPSRAHRTARQLAGRQLGVAEGATPPELDQSPSVTDVAVHRENRSGNRFDMDDMIVVAPVLIGILERSPPRGEREPTVVTYEVPEVRHGASIPRCRSLRGHLFGQLQQLVLGHVAVHAERSGRLLGRRRPDHLPDRSAVIDHRGLPGNLGRLRVDRAATT